MVDCLQDMCTYFGTSQRLQILIDVKVLYIVPVIIPVFNNATQVFSVHKLLNTVIICHWLLQNYYDIVKPMIIGKK